MKLQTKIKLRCALDAILILSIGAIMGFGVLMMLCGIENL